MTDLFDNPFVDETFVRASEGFFTAGKILHVQSAGYRIPFDVIRNSSSLGVKAAHFLAHGSSPLGGAFWNPDGAYERNEGAFHEVLDQLAEASGADVVLWPYFPLDAREFQWLQNWLGDRLGASGANQILMARKHFRAFLNSESDAISEEEGGLQLSRNKRKTTGRQLRRLSELGALEFQSTRDKLPVSEAIETFLRVEASGWKAQSGTALAVDEKLKDFAHKVLPKMLEEDRVRIDLMTLDGRSISGLISFRAGRGMFTWKTGMDDVYKRYSPGVQILLEASRQAIEDPGIDYVDSLADSGHPVAEHIWSGRRSLALLFIPLSTFGMVATHGLRTAYVARDNARYWAKRALGRV